MELKKPSGPATSLINKLQTIVNSKHTQRLKIFTHFLENRFSEGVLKTNNVGLLTGPFVATFTKVIVMGLYYIFLMFEEDAGV